MRFSNRVKSKTELKAVVTRADGTVEDLGVIASTKPSWWSRLFFKYEEK